MPVDLRRSLLAYLVRDDCGLFSQSSSAMSITESDLNCLFVVGGSSIVELIVDLDRRMACHVESIAELVQLAHRRRRQLVEEIHSLLTDNRYGVFEMASSAYRISADRFQMADAEDVFDLSGCGIPTADAIRLFQMKSARFGSIHQLICALRCYSASIINPSIPSLSNPPSLTSAFHSPSGLLHNHADVRSLMRHSLSSLELDRPIEDSHLDEIIDHVVQRNRAGDDDSLPSPSSSRLPSSYRSVHLVSDSSISLLWRVSACIRLQFIRSMI